MVTASYHVNYPVGIAGELRQSVDLWRATALFGVGGPLEIAEAQRIADEGQQALPTAIEWVVALSKGLVQHP